MSSTLREYVGELSQEDYDSSVALIVRQVCVLSEAVMLVKCYAG